MKWNKPSKEQLQTIAKKVGLGILIGFLAVETIVLALWTFGGEKAVAKFPIYIIQITSDSMNPTLKMGDCVLAASTPFSSVKKGNLVSFYAEGSLITHEVIAVNENGTITTKGAMNNYDDGEISESIYMGKVLFKVPFLHVFLKLMETPMQKALWIVLILVLFFGTEVSEWVLTKGPKLPRQRYFGRKRPRKQKDGKTIWK